MMYENPSDHTHIVCEVLKVISLSPEAIELAKLIAHSMAKRDYEEFARARSDSEGGYNSAENFDRSA